MIHAWRTQYRHVPQGKGKKEMGNLADRSEIIEVRLNCLQMTAIDEALERMKGSVAMRASWYRLGLDHLAELKEGRPVTLTLAARLGPRPLNYQGERPEMQGEWLPVMARALTGVGHHRLAALLTALYEVIARGFGEELYFMDGIFDLATIGGRKRLEKRRAVIEKIHGANVEMEKGREDVKGYIEG